MESSSFRLPPRACGLCGHDMTAHTNGTAQNSRYCKLESCDCGEFISPLSFGCRWNWSDAEIRKNLQRLAGYGRLQSEQEREELDQFAFGDEFVIDFRKPPKLKSET